MKKLTIEQKVENLTHRDREYALYLYARLKDCEDTAFGRWKAEKILRDWFHYRDHNKADFELDPETGKLKKTYIVKI